jgi:hypothetical protein
MGMLLGRHWYKAMDKIIMDNVLVRKILCSWLQGH